MRQVQGVDGFEDGDGCPDEDNDADGITDVQDLCPNNSEDSDGINDGDGCAEADGKGFFGNRIVISQHKIFSSTDDFAISDAGLFLTTGLVNWWRKVTLRYRFKPPFPGLQSRLRIYTGARGSTHLRSPDA